MHLGKLGRGLAAMTVIVMLGAACTPDPEVPPTPSPSVPATPAETELERQERVAYEAAEKSYRTFQREYGRVVKAGGAKSPTNLMTKTAGGPYLEQFTQLVRGYEVLGAHQRGDLEIIYVRQGGYSPQSLILNVCEDDRSAETILKNGKSNGKGEIRTTELDVRKRGQDWKVWDGESREVESCE